MKDRKYRIPLTLCAAAVWIFLINHFAGIYFETNDDRLLSEIFSGSMTGSPEAHSYYVDYILGFVLALLYRVTDAVPWYGGMLVLFQFLCWFFTANAFSPPAETGGSVLRRLCAVLSCMPPAFM